MAFLSSLVQVSSVRGPQGRSAMDAVERVYAREVYARNEAILTGVSHDLVHVFYTAMQQFQDKVCVCVCACACVCVLVGDCVMR